MQHSNYHHNESTANNHKYFRACKQVTVIFASLGFITGGSLSAFFIVPEYFLKADVSTAGHLVNEDRTNSIAMSTLKGDTYDTSTKREEDRTNSIPVSTLKGDTYHTSTYREEHRINSIFMSTLRGVSYHTPKDVEDATSVLQRLLSDVPETDLFDFKFTVITDYPRLCRYAIQEKRITDVKYCRFTTKGIEYKGKVNHTMSGIPCQRWDTDKPHKRSKLVKNDETIIYEENYCRNPDADWSPWCYTTNDNIQFQYCYIPMCFGNFSPKSDGKMHDILKLLKQRLSKNNMATLLTSLIVDCTGTWMKTLKVINKQFPKFCNEAKKGYVLNHTASGKRCKTWTSQTSFQIVIEIEIRKSANVVIKNNNQCKAHKDLDLKWCAADNGAKEQCFEPKCDIV